MTPARAAALEAVAEAARTVEFIVNEGKWDTQDGCDAFEAIEAALRDLRALSSVPAEPEPDGEMVTLGLMEHRGSRKLAACTEPNQEDHRYWTHIGNLTFRRPARPVVPEVVAEVVKP